MQQIQIQNLFQKVKRASAEKESTRQQSSCVFCATVTMQQVQKRIRTHIYIYITILEKYNWPWLLSTKAHAWLHDSSPSQVGANNVSFLFPAGQFGTRIQGGPVLDSFQWARLDLRNDLCRFVSFCPSGKDAASARYIYTRLERQGPHEPVHCHQGHQVVVWFSPWSPWYQLHSTPRSSYHPLAGG